MAESDRVNDNGGAARGPRGGGNGVGGVFATATGNLSAELMLTKREVLRRSQSAENETTASATVVGAEKAPRDRPKRRGVELAGSSSGSGSGSISDCSLPSAFAATSSSCLPSRPTLSLTPQREQRMPFDLAMTPMQAGRRTTATSAAIPRWRPEAGAVPAPVPSIPPPIDHSISFELSVSAVPATRRTSGIPTQPQLAAAAAEADVNSRRSSDSPDAHAAGDRTLETVKEGTRGAISCPSLSSATTMMSMSPTKEEDTMPPASREFSARFPPEERSLSAGEAPVSPMAAGTDRAAGKSSDPCSSGQQQDPSFSAASQSPGRVLPSEPSSPWTLTNPADPAAAAEQSTGSSSAGESEEAAFARSHEKPPPSKGSGEAGSRVSEEPIASSAMVGGMPGGVKESLRQQRGKVDDAAAVEERAVQVGFRSFVCLCVCVRVFERPSV